MSTAFPVPHAYREMDLSPARQAWVETLSARAAALAERWSLTPEGEPRYGFLSVVWPVHSADGRALVLKIHADVPGTDGERLALAAARGPWLVDLVDADPAASALLLERLDAERNLEKTSDVDAACEVIAGLAAQITAHDAPPGVRSMADEMDRLHASTTAMLERTPEVLPRALADRALETLTRLSAALRAATPPLPLIHTDLHFHNVLHTLPEAPPRWVAIDPLPAAGYPECEVIAVLRNRWDAALETGDPERALWRRFDILGERMCLDRELAVDLAQAVAVENVLWLARDASAHPVAKSFLAPYSIVARWT